NMIVDFKEKEETGSNIINAGVYVFNKDVFNFFDKDVKSLERDLFPKLAKLNQLQGFFTKGEYYHAGGN
ncbi:NDP-sugar synthase, partial [Candidatus Woesearchaeota archaeon]|nr:NDP-sugar synthase [Candidatus Woesearchaeota archaeon]